MSSRQKSIRKQLLLWLLIPILCIIILSIFSSYYLASHFSDIAFDTELAENAKGLAGHVVYKNGQWTLASPQLSRDSYSHDAQDKVYFLITDPKGEFIGGERLLGLPIQSSSYPAFSDKRMHNEPVRVVTLKIPLKHDQHQSFMLIQLAETLNERSILANQVLITTIAHQLFLALLATVFVWFGVTRGLIPLERLQRDLAKRTPNDLRSLPDEYIPQEVRPLTGTINALMKRISGYIESQKRFTANAAHQLRTPLAGLQTQLEVALRQTDPAMKQHALEQMQVSLDRSIHLSQQLLSLAKAEPNALEIENFPPVDLTALTQEVVAFFVPQALKKEIDFGYEGSETPIVLKGNENHLRDLLSNLIDNALLYTPTGGRVTVRLSQEPKITFSVEDSGPGIPESEKEKVFERFYRLGGNNVPGSGLGLSIVREIAQTHQAQVTIHEGNQGQGALILVSFSPLQNLDTIADEG